MKLRTARLVSRAGATLLEVMVALGILATTYVALLQVHGGAMRLSAYGREISIATFLAREKLEQVEYELNKDGFPDMDETEEGNFEEQGFPGYSWQLEIRKLELPVGAAFESLAGNLLGGEEGEQSALTERLGGLGGSGQLAGMLKGGAGGGLGGAAALLNPEALRGQAEMLAQMLEEAIREVRLKVSWAEGKSGQVLEVVTHLVRVPQASGAAGAAPARAGQPGTQPGGFPPRPGAGPGMRPPAGFQPSINRNFPGRLQSGSINRGNK